MTLEQWQLLSLDIQSIKELFKGSGSSRLATGKSLDDAFEDIEQRLEAIKPKENKGK